MANDINMYGDIEDLGDSQEGKDLSECYNARYQDGDIDLAEILKEQFIEKYGYWGNWY